MSDGGEERAAYGGRADVQEGWVESIDPLTEYMDGTRGGRNLRNWGENAKRTLILQLHFQGSSAVSSILLADRRGNGVGKNSSPNGRIDSTPAML
jgi:hypothetical protein